VYSLGCVLYQMLTERAPFEADTPVSIAYKHVNETPVPPREIAPSIPPHLDQAVLRALEKDPDARFPTAEAFRAAVAGEGTATIPLAAPGGGDTDVLPAAAPAGTTAPLGRRSRSWFPVALVAAAVLAIVGVVAAASREPEPAGRRGDRGGGGQPSQQQSIPAVPSVGEALGRLEDVVIAAVESGDLSEEAGAKILEEAGKAFEAYSSGDLDKALESLGHAHEEVDKAVDGDEGRFASPEATAALHAAIDAVAGAMEASPPPTAAPEEDTPAEDEGESDEGEGGPGNSENAPGHEKKDGKGKGEDDD
jgi:serine/threonine-protein kinase